MNVSLLYIRKRNGDEAMEKGTKEFDGEERKALIQNIVKMLDDIEDLRKVRFYYNFILKMEKEEI
ncbi:hypothetical protein [Eubacterium sp. AF15-50]|uniref:hypothetical protein n=1 Tax=Eubacterium sp. AF15-50 TaxID=2293103 RepID=UPI0026732D1B|nr:hypothetical protein [Eubacterium sp. AF15-50]